MSEPITLIPNLNEIMEEYVELEDQTIQTTQTVAEQAKERVDEDKDPEQIVKDSRKRKRGNEETEIGEQKASEWVSNMAYISWRDKLQHRDFIGERGFSKWISPFQELIESKGWHLLCEHKAPEYVDMVKEFYANMIGTKDKTIYVRGIWVSFSKEQINQTFNLQEMKDGSKFKRLIEAPNFHKIVDMLTGGKGKWNATRKNPHESIAKGALTEQAKVSFYFLCSVILPSKHLCIVREKEAVFLYAILKGYKFNVGKLIENSILSYYRGGYKGLILHPRLISRLCILGGVQGDWEEEESCPKTSPLTLTRITKGSKNRGRGTRVEAV